MDADMIKKYVSENGFQLIETHISWILIGKEFAYKIKKPLKFSFLDFSSPAKRRFFCGEEVRLNRRLTKDIYLSVVKIAEHGGKMRILEETQEAPVGSLIEYAVKMRTLDGEKKMDKLLLQGKVRESDMKTLAGIVAEFHQKAEKAKDDYGTPDIIWGQVSDLGNFKETIQKACRMGASVEFVLGRSKAFMDKNRGVFLKRIAEGMVKDCHGDLHSGNIFMDNGMIITDCIEFNRDFRCIDVASDVAFMAMDLDAFGKSMLSDVFVEEYVSRTHDEGLMPLLGFYKCYRANVRAKVAAIEWMQHESSESAERMKKYLTLAEKYAAELR
jgi:hypothetical protein